MRKMHLVYRERLFMIAVAISLRGMQPSPAHDGGALVTVSEDHELWIDLPVQAEKCRRTPGRWLPPYQRWLPPYPSRLD